MNPTTQTVSELITLLVRQKNIHTGFYELSKLKQKAVVAGDTDGLSAIVQRENKVLFELRQLGAARDAKIREAAAALGLTHSDMTLADLIDATDDPSLRAKLAEVRTGLSEIVALQQNINRTNETLLLLKLDYTRGMVEAMTHLTNPNNMYDDGGHADESKERVMLFDQHA